MPPKLTLLTLLRLMPVIVTVLPVTADVGLKELIAGNVPAVNVNPGNAAIPAGVASIRSPEEPNPTVAVSVVEEMDRNDATAVPPKLTLLILVRLVPVTVITSPIPADVGVKELMTGGGDVE